MLFLNGLKFSYWIHIIPFQNGCSLELKKRGWTWTYKYQNYFLYPWLCDCSFSDSKRRRRRRRETGEWKQALYYFWYNKNLIIPSSQNALFPGLYELKNFLYPSVTWFLTTKVRGDYNEFRNQRIQQQSVGCLHVLFIS